MYIGSLPIILRYSNDIINPVPPINMDLLTESGISILTENAQTIIVETAIPPTAFDILTENGISLLTELGVNIIIN